MKSSLETSENPSDVWIHAWRFSMKTYIKKKNWNKRGKSTPASIKSRLEHLSRWTSGVHSHTFSPLQAITADRREVSFYYLHRYKQGLHATRLFWGLEFSAVGESVCQLINEAPHFFSFPRWSVNKHDFRLTRKSLLQRGPWWKRSCSGWFKMHKFLKCIRKMTKTTLITWWR